MESRQTDEKPLRFRRFLYRTYATFSGHSDRRSSGLTPAGWAAISAMGAAAVMGLNTNETTAYQLFVLFAAIFVVGRLMAVFFRPRLEISRVVPSMGSAGTNLVYRMVVRNLSKRRHSALRVSEQVASVVPLKEMFLYQPEPLEATRNGFDRTFLAYRWMWLRRHMRLAEAKESDAIDLAPEGTVEVEVSLMPLRRGVLRLQGIRVRHADPFGWIMYARRMPSEKTSSVIVLPKRYPLPPLRLGGESRYQPCGVALAGSVGQSEEFVGLREYRPGDPLRHIHWKSWARTGSPIVMEFEDEFVPRYALLLDTFAVYDRDNTFEEAVSIAASFACTLDTQDSLLDLMFVGTEAYRFTSGRGTTQPERLLDVLAAVDLCRDKGFGELTELVVQHSQQLSACVCILIDWDESRHECLQRLRAERVDVLALWVGCDGEELPVEAQRLGVRPLTVGRIAEGLARL